MADKKVQALIELRDVSKWSPQERADFEEWIDVIVQKVIERRLETPVSDNYEARLMRNFEERRADAE